MVIKGWYIPSFPGSEGDSTVWYVSYWSFVAAYLESKFGEQWCLSPELSLYYYSGKSVIPKQLIVRSDRGTNNILNLPFGTSVLDIKASLPPVVEREPGFGIRLYPLTYALLMVGPDYYRRNALEARTCLSVIRDISPIVSAAIDGGHTTRAGRVAGALRSIGREELADLLLSMMRQTGYVVMEENPFEENVRVDIIEKSPYAARIKLMWQKMRTVVISCLNSAGIVVETTDVTSVLSMMDATYIKDSYNSLSIEGYKITEGLLEKVRSGNWDPKNDEEDKERKNALAARGYYQAYQLLRQNIAEAFDGQEPALMYVRNSMHVPLNPEAVLDAMIALSTLMQEEPDAFVRAVLGHFFFVYIHPFMDGNGRTARFAMNSQLVTGGYPWIVVPVERREDYMSALEKASVEEDIEPFARFICSLV